MWEKKKALSICWTSTKTSLNLVGFFPCCRDIEICFSQDKFITWITLPSWITVLWMCQADLLKSWMTISLGLLSITRAEGQDVVPRRWHGILREWALQDLSFSEGVVQLCSEACLQLCVSHSRSNFLIFYGSWYYFTHSLVSRSDFQKKCFFLTTSKLLALHSLLLPSKKKLDFSSPQLFWWIPKSLLSST